MSDLSSKSCVILDHGYFLELAIVLAREFGKVYYTTPWQSAQSKVDGAVIGDGYQDEGVHRVDEIWDVIDEVDCAIFPDVHHAGMQLHIEKLGIPTWGARRADELEIKKLMFKKFQEAHDMNFAEYDVIEGMDELRDYCRHSKNNDRWIKMTPQYRGSKETFHHKDYHSSSQTLAEMDLDLGILPIRFIAEKPIKGKLEGGLDTYTIDGEHPSVAVQGYEKKDLCYFAHVQKWENIPEEIRSVTEPLWTKFKELRARQMFSTEVKITPDGKSYLLEPTTRFPSPAGEEQMEVYKNMPQIIWAGANGRLIEPEIEWEYCCEAMVEHNGNKLHAREVQIPDSVRRWFKLYNTCKVDNHLWIAPGNECIGAVVGVGNTPEEALEHLKENAKAMDDQPVTIHTKALAEIFEEIEEAESKGIAFSEDQMPSPESVITNGD